HNDLREATLAALMWADDSFDDRHRSMLWPLLMQLPVLLDRAAGSTLVLFAGDVNIDVGLHCAGDPSLVGKISADGYEKRKACSASSDAIKQTTRLTAEEAPLVALFLGAGASVVEGLPTGNELRNRALARQLELPRVDFGNFEKSARVFYERLLNNERLRPGELGAGEDAFAASLTLERVLLEEQFQEHRADSATIRNFATEHSVIAS